MNDKNTDIVSEYTKAVESVPVLTEEEELALVKEGALGKGDAKEKLLEATLRYTLKEAKKYEYCANIVDDIEFLNIIQSSNNGLIESSEYLNNLTGSFREYASEFARVYVVREIAQNLKKVTFPMEFLDSYEKLLAALARRPLPEEIADYMDTSLDEVNKMIPVLQADVLYDIVKKNQDLEFFETYNGHQSEFFDKVKQKNEFRKKRKKQELTKIDRIISYIQFEMAKQSRAKGFLPICGFGVSERVKYYTALLEQKLTPEEIDFSISVLGISEEGTAPIPVTEAADCFRISQDRVEELCVLYSEVAAHTHGLYTRRDLFFD